MAALEFEKDEQGEVCSKNALEMYSKDGEKVKLAEVCDCDGQVEVWLNRLLDDMVESIRKEFTEAVVAYEEKPRDQWLFDFPAQVSHINNPQRHFFIYYLNWLAKAVNIASN